MRRPHWLVLVGAPALALCLPGPAAAGSISISILPVVELREGALSAQVKVSNVGDEAAQSVAALLVFGEHKARGEIHPSLAPGASMDATLSLTVGDSPPAKMTVSELKADPLSSAGTLRIRVKNLAGVVRQASLTLVTPEGIEVTAPVQDVKLAAWEERTVSVPIVNRTALVGSRYPVFAEVQYDDDGVHQAVVGQGMVAIEAAHSFFEVRRTWFWIVAGVLVALWLGFLVWRGTFGRSRRAESRP